jgi:putative glutamine amidotransferase
VKPAIGIPECHDAGDRIRPGRQYLYNDIAYARAVSRAGGTAFHLPIQADPTAVIERIDGLLLPGGDDFVPPGLTRDTYPHLATTDEQLEFDRALLQHALERDMPILGICYGAQLMALELGGSLHYHVPDDVEHALEHQLDENTGRHGVVVQAGSRLGTLTGRTEFEVNSLHHQAINEPGETFIAVATSRDGVTEGIERQGAAFCLGVQWHPEKLDDDVNRALFRGFVAAAAKFSAN